MEYVIVAIIIVALLGAKVISDTKSMKKRVIALLKEKWGKFPECDYTDDKYKEIKKYYESSPKKSTDIDDITWNDVDMDRVFRMINNTSCSIGEEYLYAMLHRIEFREEELDKREKLISYFQKQEEDRLTLQSGLAYMGKMRGMSFYKSFSTMGQVKTCPIRHMIMCGGFILTSVLLLFSVITAFHAGFFAFCFVLMLANNVFQYYKRKAEIEKYYYMLSYVLKLFYSVEKMIKIDIEILAPYREKFKNILAAFGSFRKQAKFVTGGNNMTGSLADVILDYVRMLFHVDLFMFDFLIRKLEQSEDKIRSLYEDIGYLDSMIAAASFRTMFEGHYCIPDFVKSKKPILRAREMYHPFIENPVKNTIKEENCVLITGSNASGKSTFIKTIAMNAILAQTIHTCMCESYQSSLFQIYSSMALKDNLLGKESYYMVEIKSLKRILDRTENGPFVLCFVDEVLRGTNTLERIAASSQILKVLSEKKVLCFAATHDIELTYILEKYYANYHFQEEIKEGQVIFNYQLQRGRAFSRNAIKLLQMTGYPKEIIEGALGQADYFLAEGVWQTAK